MSYGARTESADVPAGTATYRGFAAGNSNLKINGSRDHRLRINGSLRLTADFGDSTLTGAILGIRVRNQTGGDLYLPDTVYFDISNGQIADGKFTADLAGVDPRSSAPADESVQGYQGTVNGEFYGPVAEEVGGVFNASRQDRVMAGVFGASQLAPRVSGDGLTKSPATPVYAANTDDLGVLFDAGSALVPLNSVLRRAGGRGTDAVDNAYVKTVTSDGNNGVRVTYVVGGQEETVHFTTADFQNGVYGKSAGTGGADMWDYSGRFDDAPQYTYLSLNGFQVWSNTAPTMRYYLAYGARTAAANLPTGTATYTGTMSADSYNQGNSSSALQNRYSGSLSLTANFDQSSVEGMISDLVIRRYDDPSTRVSLPVSTQFEISNGQIVNGQFTADLAGMDTNASASLRESVRGFEGSVLGEFYGPAAEEVGGVLNARRDEDLRVMGGVFGGTR